MVMSSHNGRNGLSSWQKAQRKVRYYKQQALQPLRWLAYTTGQTKHVPPPDRMYIESTNICNLSCIMCPTGLKQISRPQGFMDFEVFKQIVDEMAPWVRATTLHIWGEPLLHKRIFDMVAYCRQKGLRAEISTNATLLTEDKARRLLEAGLDAIYLSIDGLRPETYESIRVKADYERTNQNIRRFVELKVEGGYHTFVNIQIIQMKQTLDEIKDFIKTWSIPGVDRINVKPFDSWADQIEQISALRPEEKKNTSPRRWPCPNLWYHVHIYWDGSIAMCDRDFNLRYPLGNVIDPDGKVRVMKNWNGPEMQELRRRHVENDLADVSPCNTCIEWAWWKPEPFFAQGNRPAGEESRPFRVRLPDGRPGPLVVGVNGRLREELIAEMGEATATLETPSQEPA